MLIKVVCPPERRGDIRQLVDIFRGRFVDVGVNAVMLEISGTEPKSSRSLSSFALTAFSSLHAPAGSLSSAPAPPKSLRTNSVSLPLFKEGAGNCRWSSTTKKTAHSPTSPERRSQSSDMGARATRRRRTFATAASKSSSGSDLDLGTTIWPSPMVLSQFQRLKRRLRPRSSICSFRMKSRGTSIAQKSHAP